MIELLIYIVASIVWVLLYAAWRTLPLLVAVLIIDLLFRRRIAARYHCFLWAMVMARLLMPVSIASPLNVQREVDDYAQWLVTPEAESVPYALRPIEFDTFTFGVEGHPDGKTITLPIMPADATDEYRAAAEAYVANLDTKSLANTGGQLNQVDGNSGELVFTWDIILGFGLLATWLLVTLWLLCRNLFLHRQFSRKLRKCEAITHPMIVEAVTAACQRLRLRRNPVVKEVPELSVPAVFGLWRPVVCLPLGTTEKLSSEEIDWVMMHEIAHIRRHDALLLTMAIIIRSLHWFNPFAHAAVWRLRHYMEQAADDLATRRMPEKNVLDYGRLLLRYATDSPKDTTKYATIGLLFMSSGKRLRGRIEMLDRNSARNHWLAKIFAAAMILLVGFVGMTDAQPIDYQPVPLDHEFDWSTDWLDEPIDPALEKAAEEANFIIPQEPQSEVTYDVGDVLEKLAAAEPEVDPAENLKSYFFIPPGFPKPANSLVTLVDDKLTLRQTESAHVATERMLHSLARSGPWQIWIESRIFVADPKVASAIDWQHRGFLPAQPVNEDAHSDQHKANQFPNNLPKHFPKMMDSQTTDTLIQGTHEVTGSLPMIAVKVSPQQAKYFVSRAEREPESHLVQAPKVTLFNGQYAVLSDQVQRAFVTGVRAKKNSDSMQPIIEVVNDGWQVELMAEVTEDEKIDLYCVLTQSEIENVRLATLPFANDVATVQVPKVNRTSIHSTVRLNQGDSLLIMSPTTYDPKESTRSPAATFYMLTPEAFLPKDILQGSHTPTD